MDFIFVMKGELSIVLEETQWKKTLEASKQVAPPKDSLQDDSIMDEKSPFAANLSVPSSFRRIKHDQTDSPSKEVRFKP
jgi:hypothetical protein